MSGQSAIATSHLPAPPASAVLARLRRHAVSRLVTIRGRLLLGFFCMTVITGGLGAYAAATISESTRLVTEIFDNSLMAISFARAAAVDFAAMEALAARRRSVTDAAGLRDLAGRIDALAQTLRDDLAVAAERSQSDKAAQSAHLVAQAAASWRAAERALPAGATSEAEWKTLDAASATVDAQVDLLVNFTAGDGFTHRQHALASIALDRRLSLGATLGALLLTAVVALLLARRIIGPVADASAAAARIAEGELDTVIPRGGADELGALLSAMAVMRDNIRAMVQREVAQRRSAQGRLVDAIEGSREGVVLVDGEGQIVIANTQLTSFFPTIAGRLAPGVAFSAVADEPAARAAFARQAAREVPLDDGRWLRISRSTTREGGFVAICGDITLEKAREAELERTNRHFDAALSNMSQGLCLYDADNRLLVANRRFAELFRLPTEQIRPGISFRDMLRLSVAAGNHADDRLAELHATRADFIARRQHGTHFQELADGRVVAISHEPMHDGGWVATYEDITERRRAEAQITFMARHDALTRLPNRVLFRERLDQALAQLGRGQAFAVLCVDLDNFKAVNDTLGHPVGDRLLQAVAERLLACVRETDTVARLGGDEFAIVQMGVPRPDDAVELARRIVAAVGQPYQIDTHNLAVGVSLGIAMAGNDGTSSDTLMKNADLALYRAKQDGRGTYRFFEPAMDARLQARRALELDLRRAVANDEFELFYQPLVELRANRVSGFEALIRWRHPTRGMVPPVEFIPVAEEIGLIVPLGEWVIRRACAQAAAWPEQVKVAVNISPAQFRSPQLVETVMEALADSGLPAHRLELEITESVLLTDNDATLATLHRLRDLGARISMDDFGTGYSSLSYLRSFPFDKIKIDQSFIRDLATKPDSAAIVRAITGLGTSLGMRTTAEGVETEEQLSRLRAEGCTEVQGYIFSQPRCNGDIPALLQRLADSLRQTA